MTEKKRFEIYEATLRIFNRDGWTCRNCGKPLLSESQLAHGISKSKSNLEKYGADIIHSDYNLYSACCLKCNNALAIGKSKEAGEAERIRELNKCQQ